MERSVSSPQFGTSLLYECKVLVIVLLVLSPLLCRLIANVVVAPFNKASIGALPFSQALIKVS